MGKKPSIFRRSSSRRRPKPPPGTLQPTLCASSSQKQQSPGGEGSALVGKGKKKAGGAKLWMRFHRTGKSELVECDKTAIIRRAAIPARDLRILSPLFSNSSSILAREKAMVVNLEFVKAIVTAEEVLLLDPLRQEVLPFVDQLRQQLPSKSAFRTHGAGPMEVQESEKHVPTGRQWSPVPEAVEILQSELPFELHVLEIALEVVCTYLDSNVADLERDAYPLLDELARNVSTKNLERVRSLKSNLTRLLARVQKVRDEIEQLLDDNEDMAHLYLTRKWIQKLQSETMLESTGANSITAPGHLHRGSSRRVNLVTSNFWDENNVEDLEMLLEAYFMQLDGACNKILSVREYIDDTEDYVNIRLDNHRNELIQFQLIVTVAAFFVAVETLIIGMFSMNIPNVTYRVNGIFGMFMGGVTGGCVLLFLLVLGYARWMKLLGT